MNFICTIFGHKPVEIDSVLFGKATVCERCYSFLDPDGKDVLLTPWRVSRVRGKLQILGTTSKEKQ